jgi:MFS transporter, DHA2 family, multidrug resistance protein
LSANRSGIGSALIQAVQKLGPAFAAAILGSVINSAYRAQLHLSGLPSGAAAAARKSVFAGIAVAQQLHAPGLLAGVRSAFVTSMDNALIVSGGIAVAGAALALAFLPRHSPATPHRADAGGGAQLVA